MRGKPQAAITQSTEESFVGGGYKNCNVVGREISHEGCSRYSVNSLNANICKWCPSPSKWCMPCYKQGVSEEWRLPINPKTGRCTFHDAHGDDAQRDSSTRAFTLRNQNRIKDRVQGGDAKPAKREYHRRPQEGPSDAIQATVEHEMEELPDYLFEKIADNIGNLNPASTEFRLLQLVSEKQTTKQIADKLKQNLPKTSLAISQLCFGLGVPKPTSSKSTILTGWFIREVISVSYARHQRRLQAKS